MMVADNFVKCIKKIIYLTVYLLMAFRVYPLNMGRGVGQQRPSAQHVQPTVGIGSLSMMCGINLFILEPTNNDKLI